MFLHIVLAFLCLTCIICSIIFRDHISFLFPEIILVALYVMIFSLLLPGMIQEMNSVQDLYVVIVFGFLIMVLGILLINVIKLMSKQKKKTSPVVHAEAGVFGGNPLRAARDEDQGSPSKFRLDQLLRDQRTAEGYTNKRRSFFKPAQKDNSRTVRQAALRTDKHLVPEKSVLAEVKPLPIQKKAPAAEEKPLPVREKPQPVEDRPLPVKNNAWLAEEEPLQAGKKPAATAEKPLPVLETVHRADEKSVAPEKARRVEEKPLSAEKKPQPVEEEPPLAQEEPQTASYRSLRSSAVRVTGKAKPPAAFAKARLTDMKEPPPLKQTDMFADLLGQSGEKDEEAPHAPTGAKHAKERAHGPVGVEHAASHKDEKPLTGNELEENLLYIEDMILKTQAAELKAPAKQAYTKAAPAAAEAVEEAETAEEPLEETAAGTAEAEAIADAESAEAEETVEKAEAVAAEEPAEEAEAAEESAKEAEAESIEEAAIAEESAEEKAVPVVEPVEEEAVAEEPEPTEGAAKGEEPIVEAKHAEDAIEEPAAEAVAEEAVEEETVAEEPEPAEEAKAAEEPVEETAEAEEAVEEALVPEKSAEEAEAAEEHVEEAAVEAVEEVAAAESLEAEEPAEEAEAVEEPAEEAVAEKAEKDETEARKLFEMGIIDILIADEKYEEATEAIYAFLENGYDLDPGQSEKIMNNLYILQEKA